MRYNDLTNKKFGYLTVIKKDFSRSKHTYWLCECVCGKTRSLQTYQLTSGKVTSCGCKNTKKLIIPKQNKRIYSIYKGMIARCYNSKSVSYKYYGAKGIAICSEWLSDFNCFLDWSTKNGYNDFLTIDRIDSTKDYCPTNCRWVTFKEQYYNKSDIVWYTHDNQTHTMKEWCAILNKPYTPIKSKRSYAKKLGIEPTFEYLFMS